MNTPSGGAASWPRVFIGIALAVALLASACGGSGDDGPYAGGTAAPEFPTGLEWFNTGGRALAVGELRGKVVALHFWSSGCVNCMHALPGLDELADEFADELIVIGVHAPRFSSEAGGEAVREAVLRHDIRNPVVNDATLSMARTWRVEEQPTVAVIDPAGNIAGAITGEVSSDRLREVVSSLVAEFDGALDTVAREFPLERDGLPSTVMSYPGGIVVTSGGDRGFVADTSQHRIVAMSLPGGDVLAVYGGGAPGYLDGVGTQARFRDPRGLALSDDETTLYVADTGNHSVRAIDLTGGSVTTVAGTGELGDWPPPGDGRASETAMRSPWDVAVEGDRIYVAMAGSHQLWSIDIATDEVEAVAGSGDTGVVDGPAAEALLSRPSGVAAIGRSIYFVDPESSTVRSLDLDADQVDTLGGPATGLFAYGDVDGVGRDARLQFPLGIAAEGAYAYVADTLNHKLKRVDVSSGEVVTLAGGRAGWRDGSDPRFFEPGAVDVVGSTLYLADTGNHAIRIIDLTSGETSTLVLRGIEAFAPAPEEEDFRGSVVELPLTTVAAGAGAVVVDVMLPENHKVNEEAPSSLTWKVGGDVIDIPDEEVTSLTGTVFPVSYPVTFEPGAGSLTADVNLFWCERNAESLCFIEQLRFVAPLSVGSEGVTEVLMPYEITLPEIPG